MVSQDLTRQVRKTEDVASPGGSSDVFRGVLTAPHAKVGMQVRRKDSSPLLL